MFPKSKKLIKSSRAKFKNVPNTWDDFVSLCEIKSGNKIAYFNPYPYQIELSSLMDRYSLIYIIKSRQLGITQAIMSKFLHRAALNPAYSAMCFSRNQDDASNVARRARVMVNSLNEYLKNESDSLGYMKVSGGGELFFKNSSKEGGRSYDSVSDFLFDEAAFAENISSIYSASSASSALVGDDTTKVVVSTPSAQNGWFWEQINCNNGDRDIIEICSAIGRVYCQLLADVGRVYCQLLMDVGDRDG